MDQEQGETNSPHTPSKDGIASSVIASYAKLYSEKVG
jgi:hypothetical protein